MKHLLLTVLLLSVIQLSAQNVTYRYDSAGNRTERIITLRSGLRSSAETSQVTSIDDMVSEYGLKIYPNPTKGLLKIEISNYSAGLQAVFQLHDMSGRVINSRKAESETVYFDLSGHSTGIYLLVIRINGEQVTWKIIKE